MIRVLEILLSLVIVFLIAVIVAVFLPSSGHIERVIEVSNPVTQVYDTVNGFRRYRDYAALRTFDPAVKMNLSGPETGVGAKVDWETVYKQVGNGNLTVIDSKGEDEEKQVKWALDNEWSGTNKTFTLDLQPTNRGKTVRVKMAYDVDYGWNLMWRFAGLYIHGVPDSVLQTSLANLSGMMAGFPNVDYADQPIAVQDITPRPILFISTKAPRTLDDVAHAADTALAEIQALLPAAGLVQTGAPISVTTNWGDENYTFDLAIPVDKATFTLGGKELTIPTLDAALAAGDFEEETPTEPAVLAVGDRDRKGNLVLPGNVRAAMSYGGKALVTEYTGSPASLPLLRLKERAFAETHGYKYSEIGLGRAYDEALSTQEEIYAGEGKYVVYLPISL